MGERVATLPMPRPKSPPEYPDLYGKRRELAKVQMLEREISFLEDALTPPSIMGELKFVEGLQPASRCCKEVADFVAASSDPFMPMSEKTRRSCSLWKWICRAPCLLLSSLCCSGCNTPLKKSQCCSCLTINCCHSCVNCAIPKCNCCLCPWSQCFGSTSCKGACCLPQCFRCSDCLCKCRCSCPKVNLCCCCCTNYCC